jgi:hypothetical protein
MDGKVLTKEFFLLDGSFVFDMLATVDCCTKVLTGGSREKLRLLLVENVTVYRLIMKCVGM